MIAPSRWRRLHESAMTPFIPTTLLVRRRRPDIAQAVGAVSRYMDNPGKLHWEAVKWILRYLRGTTGKALCFKGGDTILTGC